jgi:tungstate transport system ATP-binding protein
MKDMRPILQGSSLKVNRGTSTILDVSGIELSNGEVISLIGPNGAGKTTLLQVLSSLLIPTNGDILFKGDRITSKTALSYRRKIAMVFQEPLLFNTTVYANVAAGLKFRKMKKDQIPAIVEHQLNRFGIAHLKSRSAKTLSGGEAQRTSLARSFATEPEIIFLDEPFASLDPPTREALTNDLETALRSTGTTAILATHDRIEALRLSDRIAIMNKGKMIQIGKPEEVMSRPADEFVASFVGAETVLAGKVFEKNGGTFLVSVSGHDIGVVGDFQIGQPVLLFIRPENITLSSNPEKTSARNQFLGRIERIIPFGFFYKVQINCGFALTAFITGRALEELSLREQMQVYASFKATAIHAIVKKESHADLLD